VLQSSRLDAVDHVRRSRHLYRDDRASADAATIVVGGRLIAYSPDFNLACGVCEVETKGYFDVDNTPPWDTWVALLDAPNAKHWGVELDSVGSVRVRAIGPSWHQRDPRAMCAVVG
jgi:hypothetical protein